MGGRRGHSEDASISTASSKGPYGGQTKPPTSLNYEHGGNLNICYLLADYERIFQEKPRCMAIKNVLVNGG